MLSLLKENMIVICLLFEMIRVCVCVCVCLGFGKEAKEHKTLDCPYYLTVYVL